jgi:hypothetical protein
MAEGAGLERFPAKWMPVRRRKRDQMKNLAAFPLLLKRERLWRMMPKNGDRFSEKILLHQQAS